MSNEEILALLAMSLQEIVLSQEETEVISFVVGINKETKAIDLKCIGDKRGLEELSKEGVAESELLEIFYPPLDKCMLELKKRLEEE